MGRPLISFDTLSLRKRVGERMKIAYFVVTYR